MQYPNLSPACQKIGVLGGSFNPLHKGHLEMLQKVQQKKIVEEFLLIPNYKNPLEKKNYYLSATIRWKILQQVFYQQKTYILWDYELQQKRAVPSIETSSLLQKQFPTKKFYWILGADAFAKISQWQASQTLQKIINFIVFPRKNFVNPPNLINSQQVTVLKDEISAIHSSSIRATNLDYKSYSQELRDYFLSLIL